MNRFPRRTTAIVCIFTFLNMSVVSKVVAAPSAVPQAGTISGRPSIAMVTGGVPGISVNTFSGNLFLNRSDLAIPARGIPIDITASYNSIDDDCDGSFGFGWHFFSFFELLV